MGQLKAYTNTAVSLFKTQEETDRLLAKYGITGSRWTHFGEVKGVPGLVRFEFEWPRDGQNLGFRLDVNYKAETGPKGGQRGTTQAQAGRALFWHVKNLLEAVEFGIVDLEQAFFPYMLTAGGNTVYEEIKPRLAELPDAGGLLGLPARTSSERVS